MRHDLLVGDEDFSIEIHVDEYSTSLNNSISHYINIHLYSLLKIRMPVVIGLMAFVRTLHRGRECLKLAFSFNTIFKLRKQIPSNWIGTVLSRLCSKGLLCMTSHSRMMSIAKGNPHYTPRMQLVTLRTRVRLLVRINHRPFRLALTQCIPTSALRGLSKERICRPTRVHV